MKQLTCEMCGSRDLLKQDGVFVCQTCGCKYSVEEARKMMIEGTVEVQGTVKVDNTDSIEKYLTNARRALMKEDWEEVEKYYNLVEQNSDNNMEAVFFSAYGRAMLSMTDSEYFKREQKFEVLNKSISVISDYYSLTVENKKDVLEKISKYVKNMVAIPYVYDTKVAPDATGSRGWCANLINSTINAFAMELEQIYNTAGEEYIKHLIDEYGPYTITLRRKKQGVLMGGAATMDVYLNNAKLILENGEDKIVELRFGVYVVIVNCGTTAVLSPFVLKENTTIHFGFKMSGVFCEIA
ncbi:MAG: hypothetical protein E7607_07050 [Ruminococcaceae bacterium]|nr:hypothetical protein [Oscillospiraceae bacterium]